MALDETFLMTSSADYVIFERPVKGEKINLVPEIDLSVYHILPDMQRLK